MKANTPELMKFKRLQRRLNATVAQLVGHLELLWIATAKNAPEGDIGRFTDEDIAIACHWEGDAGFFVESLVECGWLDRDLRWRILIHDWAQHAPTYVHGGLKRHGRSFRAPSAEVPKEAPKEVPKEVPIGASYLDAPTKPSQVKPNQAFSSERQDGPYSRHFESEQFVRSWEAWKNKQAVSSGRMMDPSTEEAQLFSLEGFATEDACKIVQFSVSRTNCHNLILNGDHSRVRREPANESIESKNKRQLLEALGVTE